MHRSIVAASARRQLVVGSAIGAEVADDVLVLPSRRPARAEAHVSQTLVTTRPGSVVIDASSPLAEADEPLPALLDPPSLAGSDSPPGRWVTQRTLAVVRGATVLATRVGEVRTSIADFAGEPMPGSATELAALAGPGLTRDGRSRY